MRLGEFGAAQRELSGEKDDFVFCGQEFVVEQKLPAVLMLQLGAATTGKIDESEGFGAIWEAMRISLTKPAPLNLSGQPMKDDKGNVIGPDESSFRKFYGLAVDQGVELEPLMRLVMALFEAQTGRPTQQASVSSDGPPTTLPELSASSTPAGSHLRSVDDLVRTGAVKGPDPKAAFVRMGDGAMVEVDYDAPPPTAQTG